jgi:hypothetical protein
MQAMWQLLHEIHFQELEVYGPSQKLQAEIKFKNTMVIHMPTRIIAS